ncbi:MAG: hypothetical protein ACOX0D_10645 [Sphaerochaeta sp.]
MRRAIIQPFHEKLLSNKETLEFIKKLGISTPSLQDEIFQKILPKYQNQNSSIDVLSDFQKLFRYFQECSRSEEKDFIQSLKDVEFILFDSQSDDTQYRARAEELYFPSEPMVKWFTYKPDTNLFLLMITLNLLAKKRKKNLGTSLLPLRYMMFPEFFLEN